MPAPYTEEISRANPSCFVFLIDQSGSMADPFGDTGKSKANGVATVINRLLSDLVIECTKGEDKPRDYYYVGVIGYGFDNDAVGPAFKGVLAGRELVSISEIGMNPARIEERRSKELDAGIGRLIEVPFKFPVWFEPIAFDGTPMCKALREARRIVEGWVNHHPNSYPPTVINITDGESTDGNPEQDAAAITSIANVNGSRALLFNIHISSRRADPIVFPDKEEGLPDEYARLLFNMSSVLPEPIRDAARGEIKDKPIGDRARGFAFNADMTELIQFLDIGTRPSTLR